ncbi:hypothetical protein C2G38_1046465 [Gigaspora rosea]|uniref:Uncharacterized protein n=1 Tax=Gigaspora rosea TaxID=44941 RepID=A0A397TSV7_9GLOM|nr:hypothetical protein C2G38_1046465 [Gigaspora rosea]
MDHFNILVALLNTIVVCLNLVLYLFVIYQSFISNNIQRHINLFLFKLFSFVVGSVGI